MAQLPKLLQDLEKGIEGLEHRPFDRFAIGPFMIWYGLRSKQMSRWPRRAMIAGGIFQLLYAWREYRKLIGAVTTSPASVIEVIQDVQSEA